MVETALSTFKALFFKPYVSLAALKWLGLSSDDGDGNENGKTSNWLAKQQICTCIKLFCTFLWRRCTTTTWKCLNFTSCRGRGHKTTTFFFFSWTLILSFRTNPEQFANIWHSRWNKHDKVWSSANSLFQWRFRCRRRRCCLSSLDLDLYWVSKAGEASH